MTWRLLVIPIQDCIVISENDEMFVACNPGSVRIFVFRPDGSMVRSWPLHAQNRLVWRIMVQGGVVLVLTGNFNCSLQVYRHDGSFISTNKCEDSSLSWNGSILAGPSMGIVYAARSLFQLFGQNGASMWISEANDSLSHPVGIVSWEDEILVLNLFGVVNVFSIHHGTLLRTWTLEMVEWWEAASTMVVSVLGEIFVGLKPGRIQMYARDGRLISQWTVPWRDLVDSPKGMLFSSDQGEFKPLE